MTLVRDALDFVCKAASILSAKDIDALVSILYALRPELLTQGDPWKRQYYANLEQLVKTVRLLLKKHFYLIDSSRFYKEFYEEME